MLAQRSKFSLQHCRIVPQVSTDATSTSADPRVPPGGMGVAMQQRKWMNMAPNDSVMVLPFDPRVGIGPDHLLGSMAVDVSGV